MQIHLIADLSVECNSKYLWKIHLLADYFCKAYLQYSREIAAWEAEIPTGMESRLVLPKTKLNVKTYSKPVLSSQSWKNKVSQLYFPSLIQREARWGLEKSRTISCMTKEEHFEKRKRRQKRGI